MQKTSPLKGLEIVCVELTEYNGRYVEHPLKFMQSFSTQQN